MRAAFHMHGPDEFHMVGDKQALLALWALINTGTLVLQRSEFEKTDGKIVISFEGDDAGAINALRYQAAGMNDESALDFDKQPVLDDESRAKIKAGLEATVQGLTRAMVRMQDEVMGREEKDPFIALLEGILGVKATVIPGIGSMLTLGADDLKDPAIKPSTVEGVVEE